MRKGNYTFTNFKSSGIKILICYMFAFVFLTGITCTGNLALEGAKVSLAFDEDTSQVILTIDSPKAVSAAQVKFDIPADISTGEVTSSGFLTDAQYANKDQEHRWYNLSANGEKTASLTIPVNAAKDSNQVITLFGVDLKDSDGKLIPVSDQLPLSVQLTSMETQTTEPIEKGPTEGAGQSRIAFASYRDGNSEIYVIDADGNNLKQITNNPEDDYNPAWSSDGTRIAFVRHSTFDNIYIMDVDGSNLTQLTNNQANDLDPTWSPDDTRIAFTSGCDGNYEIYVMNTDGTNQRNLSMNPSADQDPTWSPDGTSIAFSSDRDGGDFEDIEIYVMNADGTNQTRLTNNAWHDYDPAWSPDGSKIAFASGRDGTDSLYVMNSDGSNQTRLTYNGRSPTWSPCCTKIAFTSFLNVTTIHVINLDGSNEAQLTSEPGNDFVPAWSPRMEEQAIEEPKQTPPTTSSAGGGKIAFASNRDGNWDIYVMNADGNDQTRLTNNQAIDVEPCWSPDGTKIAFSSNRDNNNWGIYVMNADGSNQTNLTNNPLADNSWPTWSPDGKRIAFVSPIPKGQFTYCRCIYVMNADGSGQTRLTNTSINMDYPAWSPDGSKIALACMDNGKEGIYVMNADGSGQTRLTYNGDHSPAWSPYGSKIAFASGQNGRLHIYVMNADGSGQARLTNGWCPHWSPDVTKIAFTSNRDGNDEIYVMNADGSNQTRLTNDPADDSSPAWSPRLEEQTIEETMQAPPTVPATPEFASTPNTTSSSGGKIAFTSFRNNKSQIYVMNADGSEQRNISNNSYHDEEPALSPDGTKIAFMSGRDVPPNPYIMNADGTNQTRLVNDPNSGQPAWSPDGTKIAIRGDYNARGRIPIKVVDSNGHNEKTIINYDDTGCYYISDPEWAPDGKTFAFTCYYGAPRHDSAICLVNVDGSNIRSLPNQFGINSQPSFSPDGNRIVFASNRDGNSEIYIMNVDGSNHIRLTNNSAEDQYPAWSPDGMNIAFASKRDGNYEIYVMNADGSNQTRLTNNDADDLEPSWSPLYGEGLAIPKEPEPEPKSTDTTVQHKGNGMIAFLSYDGANNIYIMNADGHNKRRLTNNKDENIIMSSPCWSPDGKKIAFSYGQTASEFLYVMNADGSKLSQLTNFGATSPTWSPNGAKIAYVWQGIYIMNADGSNPERLVKDGVDPAWSPDGTKIAFSAVHDRIWQIFLAYIDTGNLTILTNDHSMNSFSPSWSPDGTKIAYQCGSGIYIMSSDGNNQVQLTKSPLQFGIDGYPTWSPDGTKIAFDRDFISTTLKGNQRHSEICTVNTDGSNLTQLTDLPILSWDSVWNSQPAWSPR